MARKPLYPKLPDETALDKFLNQTLPRLQQRKDAIKRRKEDIDRQDAVRKENFARQDKVRKEDVAYRDGQNQIRIEETAFGYHSKGLDEISEGNDELGLSYLERADKLYTRKGGYNPYGSVNDVYDKNISSRSTLDGFQSLQQQFYTSSNENMSTNFDNLKDYYQKNAADLNWSTTMGATLSIINNQYKRFEPITNAEAEIDFSGFQNEILAWSKYQTNTAYRYNDDLVSEVRQANPETYGAGIIPQRDLEDEYFKKYKDVHSQLANSYMDSALAAHEFPDLQVNEETWNSLGPATRQGLDKKFRDAMANSMFGHQTYKSWRYTSLNEKDRKKVDLALKEKYNFPLPSEISYSNNDNVDNNNSGDNIINNNSGNGSNETVVDSTIVSDYNKNNSPGKVTLTNKSEREKALQETIAKMSKSKPLPNKEITEGTIFPPNAKVYNIDFLDIQGQTITLSGETRVDEEVFNEMLDKYKLELKRLKAS